MRATCLVPLFLVLATSANAAPLDEFNEGQKAALGQLFAGYSEAFLCGKEVNFEIAAAFLKSKLGVDQVSIDQAAQLAHFAIGIHVVNVTRLQQQQASTQKDAAQKLIKEHCMLVERAFGPEGKVISGLLK